MFHVRWLLEDLGALLCAQELQGERIQGKNKEVLMHKGVGEGLELGKQGIRWSILGLLGERTRSPVSGLAFSSEVPSKIRYTINLITT